MAQAIWDRLKTQTRASLGATGFDVTASQWQLAKKGAAVGA